MSITVSTIDKEYFFNPGYNVHIHISNECKDYVGVLHNHEFIEVVYIISGKAKHVIDQNEYRINKGDISIINPGESHAFYADKECEEEFLAYDLMFTPDFLDSSLFEGGDFSLLSDSFLFYSLFHDDISKNNYNLIEGCGYELESVFDKIYHEYKGNKVGNINLIRVYIVEIIIKLIRRIKHLNKNPITPAQRKLVSQVTEYIQKNYNININTSEIASNLFFHKNYIAKLFKKETGLSIHEFIREIRLKEVCRLLITTDKTIIEIASECGFSDIKTFYQTFKKHTGMTPKKYRDTRKI